ncbi:putative transposase [Lactiplantibacillus plantarum]|nr:putative transposase [Lactiplantibacillus plantarum]
MKAYINLRRWSRPRRYTTILMPSYLKSAILIYSKKRATVPNIITRSSHKRLAGRSIDERPKSIDQRQEFGHFELDTVVGKRNGQESVILTLIERQSRCQILRLIDGRDADSVNYELAKICQEYGSIMKSVTADNGAEFSEVGTVLTGVADLYYAHPYRSSERGTNEAHNRMIRRDVPKGLSMDILGPHDIQAVESKLNNLPRRQTGYQTPKELFSTASAG